MKGYEFENDIPPEATEFEIKRCSNCVKYFPLGYDLQLWESHKRQLHFPFAEKCFLSGKPSKGFDAELYDTPWEKQGHLHWFCSKECRERYTQPGDFNYYFCGGCNRQVCYQNPRNGWHVQFRDHKYQGFVCLKCYQEEILENGQPREDFEGDGIRGGMFFSSDNQEPFEREFEIVPAFSNYFIRDLPSIKKYNGKALEMIDEGGRVITGYERLAIGGLEGYVTMFVKFEEEMER